MLKPKELILGIHKFFINQSKEIDGIMHPESLDSVANNISQTFGSIELYPTVEEKAAFLALGIIKNHIFNNANKRTGVGVLLQYLKLSGISMSYTSKELVELGLNIANSKYDKDEILNWIYRHKS